MSEAKDKSHKLRYFFIAFCTGISIAAIIDLLFPKHYIIANAVGVGAAASMAGRFNRRNIKK